MLKQLRKFKTGIPMSEVISTLRDTQIADSALKDEILYHLNAMQSSTKSTFMFIHCGDKSGYAFNTTMINSANPPPHGMLQMDIFRSAGREAFLRSISFKNTATEEELIWVFKVA